MLIPISWLKEYVEINLPLKELMWRMTEVGMTTESFTRVNSDTILDVEVTPNRPDWMSVIGIAREVAAIQNSKLTLPNLPSIPKAKEKLPLKINTNYDLFKRWSGIIISDIKIKPSPKWLQDKLKLVGLRPINNIVDITNFVMLEMGMPMHAFDFDEIKGSTMSLELSRGGEVFTSVDELEYKLPKDAMIIKDKERIIDLAGIKGGLNSGIKATTKNIFLHATIDNPVLTRRTSQALSLRSEASAIYERGPDAGGTVNAVKRALGLILETSGGNIASDLIDLSAKDFKPKTLSLDINNLEKVLGIKIETKEVVKLLSSLNLSPKLLKERIECTIPTYRGDIKIEEDLFEEVARLYGYNKFPKTLPYGTLSTNKVPYAYDYNWENELKDYLYACGYSEVKTLALISENQITNSGLDVENHIKIANPISSEFEYMRTSLIPSLLTGIKVNADEPDLKIFEYDKVYLGPVDKPREIYKIAVIEENSDFRSIKGTIDLLLESLNISDAKIKPTAVDRGLWHPVKSGVIEIGEDMLGTFGELHPKMLDAMHIKDKILAFELDVELLKKYKKVPLFQPIPLYPPQIEDVTVKLKEETGVGNVIRKIKSASKLISRVELTDVYENNYTFRVWYQHPEKTLKDKDIKIIREKVLKSVK